jgi:hypothetical protein
LSTFLLELVPLGVCALLGVVGVLLELLGFGVVALPRPLVALAFGVVALKRLLLGFGVDALKRSLELAALGVVACVRFLELAALGVVACVRFLDLTTLGVVVDVTFRCCLLGGENPSTDVGLTFSSTCSDFSALVETSFSRPWSV